MGEDDKTYSQEIQDRIRELAHSMWESAGRLQGLATEYWVAAEKEVLATMRAAAVPQSATPPACLPPAPTASGFGVRWGLRDTLRCVFLLFRERSEWPAIFRGSAWRRS